MALYQCSGSVIAVRAPDVTGLNVASNAIRITLRHFLLDEALSNAVATTCSHRRVTERD